MKPRGTVRLWRDGSNTGRELEESLCDHGWIVRTTITGSAKPVASQEAGGFAHGYSSIRALFSLCEPRPLRIGDLSDDDRRSILAGDGGVGCMYSAEFHGTGPDGELAAVAEEPDDDDWDDDDEDWDDDDDDEDWDDDDEDDNDSVKQLKFKYTLHPDDLKPICDISELRKGDLIAIADITRTSVENELVWKITHDEVQRGVLAKTTTGCGATMVVGLQQGDVWTKAGRIEEADIKGNRNPDDRRDDIFRKIFN